MNALRTARLAVVDPPSAGLPSLGSTPRIEQNVPLPPITRGVLAPLFQKMKVGESFWTDRYSGKTLQAMASRAGAKLGRKFITRGEKGGRRVWRVE